jgi:hypothetical protein
MLEETTTSEEEMVEIHSRASNNNNIIINSNSMITIRTLVITMREGSAKNRQISSQQHLNKPHSTCLIDELL